jgi:hypothetical protein
LNCGKISYPLEKNQTEKIMRFLKAREFEQNIPFSISDAKSFQHFTHLKKCVVWWFL